MCWTNWRGKSACINEILQEYKSKEYVGKKSILKEKPFYYDSKLPIRILEIDTTDYYYKDNDLEQFINYVRKIKLENFHLILYIISRTRTHNIISKKEKILLKELEKSIKSKLLKIIFVITRGFFDDEDEDEYTNKFLDILFTHGGHNLKNDISHDNFIFVNFHEIKLRKEFFQKYGTEYLLEKIYNYFEKSKEIINTNNKLDSTVMNNNALNLILSSKFIIEKNNKTINELNHSLNDKIKEIEDLKNKIKQLEEPIKKLDNINQFQKPLEKEINKFEKVNNLGNKFLESKFSFELLSNEKKISIIIISMDENINYSIICKTTNIFYDIEKRFYEKYKEYKELVDFFMANGKIIKRDKNLEEKNGIHNNDIIYLYL